MSASSRRKRSHVSPQPLVDSDFMKIIAAWSPSASRRIFALMEQYQKLLAFGWTTKDIELAVAMGYNIESHLVYNRWQWKYARDAKPFYHWVDHHYRRYRAEELGMTLEDFMDLWRSFAEHDRRPRIAYTRSDTRIPSIQELVVHYIHARRHDLSDYEIRYEFFHYLDRAQSYLILRRKFSCDFVKKLLWESRNNPWRLDEKAAIEARLRGASHEEILASIESNTTHKLALALRRAQRDLEAQNV